MISRARIVIYSTDPEADRVCFRDTFKFPHVDVGGGWPIFGLPPSEVAMLRRPRTGDNEFYLMCDDVRRLVEDAEGEVRRLFTDPRRTVGMAARGDASRAAGPSGSISRSTIGRRLTASPGRDADRGHRG